MRYLKFLILFLFTTNFYELKAQDTTKVNFSIIKQQRYDYVKDSIRRLVIVNAPGDTIKIDSVVSSIPFIKYQIGTETYDTNLDGKVDFPKVYGLQDSMLTTFRKNLSYGATNGQSLVWSNAAGKWVAGVAAGGSPGGSDGQIQYNSSSAFAGASNVNIVNNLLVIDTSINSTITGTGVAISSIQKNNSTLNIYNKDIGFELSANPVMKAVGMFVPSSTNSGQLIGNMLGITLSGSYAAVTYAATPAYNAFHRENINSTNSANSVAGWRSNVASYYIGSQPGLGGMHSIFKWGTNSLPTTARAFAGFRNITTAPTDVEPSSLVNIIAFAWDAADANIQFMHNDATGTATKVDLGSNFPVPTANNLYECRVSWKSNNSVVNYWIRDLLTGLTNSGIVNTNLPADSTALGPANWVSSGTATASVSILTFLGYYFETEK